MRHGEAVVLLHIRDALALLIEYAQVGHDAFMTDVRTQDAVLRRLEIVGEAVKRLPSEFRDAHPTIPWRRIAGFRDVAIHHYDRVDLDRVWVLADRDAPVLLEQVRKLLAELGETR